MPARPTLEHWTTAITLVEPGAISYRGTPIAAVMETWGFPATVWLLITGEGPSPEQEDALRRVLVAACDHGLAAPSIAAARTCASTRGAPGVAMATGLLAFAGPAHGGAAGACAEVLIELRAAAGGGAVASERVAELVAERLAAGRVPGFGHPYHPRDPRVPGLMAAPLPGDAWRVLVTQVEDAIVAAKGERLHMNADAAVAALMLDAGLPASAIDLMTSIGRCVGLAAHVYEETANEAPFRAPSLSAIDYTGPVPAAGAR